MEDENLNDATQVGQSSGAEKVDKAGKATAGAIKKGKMLANIIKSLKGLGALGAVAIIAIVIILVIIIATGLIAYVTEGPGLLINKVSDIATSFFTELKTFYSGNSARFDSESQKELAEYLTNMGYKPYEFGFGKYTDEDGNFIENGDSEEATMDSKYLNAYLTADYNTYVPYEKFKAGVSKFLHIVGDVGGFLLGFETEKDTAEPTFGMLEFDNEVYSSGGESADKMGFLDSVDTDVKNKTMTFAAWEAPFKKTYYTYSMEGWTARYGKPIELSLALHIATMAPDLVYRLDMDAEEDTRIHIGTVKSTANIKFEYHVNAVPEGGTNFGGIDDSLEDLDKHLLEEKHKLTVEDLQALKDFIEDNETSDMIENVNGAYSNLKAFIESDIDTGNNRHYLEENETILQTYDAKDQVAWWNDKQSIEYMFNDGGGILDTEKSIMDSAIAKVKEEYPDVKFYTDEVGKPYSEIVGRTVDTVENETGDYTDGATTGIMNEFYLKYSKFKSDKEFTEDEQNEVYAFLQEKLKELLPNVEADIEKIKEYDSKTQEKIKEFESELDKIGLTRDAIDAAIDYNNENGDGEGTEVERIQPYIRLVERHWYRDVVFYDESDTYRDNGYNAYSKTTGERTYENEFKPVAQSDDSALAPNDKGAFYTIETVQAGGELVQVKDAIRGETNEHTKELFAGTADKPAKYFIYDGSINTAKKIDELRKVYDEAYSAAWDRWQNDANAREEAEEAVEQKEAEDGTNFYKEVNVRQNALEAFAILENSKTEDSEYILRDLKRLFLDLGYFTQEDFIKEETHVFQWPISGYINTYWPQRRYEKQQADYGTLIRSKVSTDNINAGKEADGSERIKEDEEVQIYKPNFNHDATAGEEGVPDLDAEETTPTDQTTTTSQDFVTKFLDAAKEVTTYVKENGFTYGHAEHMPPDSNGETNSDGVKRISCDRLVAWALYKCGYTDQPECGLTTSAGGSPLMDYCKEKGWERIEDVNQVQAGDIVFSGETNADKSVAAHTFICAGKDLRYDCGSADRIQLTGAYSSYTSQPFSEPITDFICAYRPAGNGKTGAIDGFEKDLNVLSPVTGEIIEEGEDYIKIKVLDTSAIPEYEEFYNEYKGICTGFTMYIRGFKKGTIDENVSSEYQRVTHTNKYFIENGYADDYEGVEQIAEEFEEAEKKRMEAPAYIEKDGKKYIKEGTVIGTTTSSDLGLYLMNRENSIVEDVESYIRLVKKGIETEFPEEFIFWLGVKLEGACEGEYDLGDSYGVEVLNDGAGNTTAFGLTHHVANTGEVPNMYPNFKEHLQSGRVPKKEAQDVFVLVLEAARASILEDIPDQNGLSESMLDALVDLHHASPSECGKVVKIFNEKKTLTVEDFENHWGTNMNYEKQLKGRGHVRGVLAVDEEYRNPYSDDFPKYTFHTETPWTDFINGTPSSQIATLE